MRTCVWQRSPSMFRALWHQLCRSTAARAAPTADMFDMILSLHFVYSPAILLYIIINILLLKRSIIAKSTVCADIFNNMLLRPLYSLLRTKSRWIEGALIAHARTGLQYDYLSAIIALQYNRVANVDRSVFDLQCERSCRSYIFSRSLRLDISFDGSLHFALPTLSTLSLFQTSYRWLSVKLLSHFRILTLHRDNTLLLLNFAVLLWKSS